MFKHEDTEEIVSEVIDEILEEYFDWEENEEVVDRGSNPRIVVGRVSAAAMEGDDEEQIEDQGLQDKSQNSGMAGQEQITLDQEEEYVTIIDASENETAEIMAAVAEGQSAVENEYLQAGDSIEEVSGDVAEIITGRGSVVGNRLEIPLQNDSFVAQNYKHSQRWKLVYSIRVDLNFIEMLLKFPVKVSGLCILRDYCEVGEVKRVSA